MCLDPNRSWFGQKLPEQHPFCLLVKEYWFGHGNVWPLWAQGWACQLFVFWVHKGIHRQFLGWNMVAECFFPTKITFGPFCRHFCFCSQTAEGRCCYEALVCLETVLSTFVHFECTNELTGSVLGGKCTVSVFLWKRSHLDHFVGIFVSAAGLVEAGALVVKMEIWPYKRLKCDFFHVKTTKWAYFIPNSPCEPLCTVKIQESWHAFILV